MNNATYSVNEPDSSAIAQTDAKQYRDKSLRTRGELSTKGKKDVAEWQQMQAAGEDLSVLNSDAETGMGIFTAMLKADGAALEATKRYTAPQRPQFTGSAVSGGTFPDNQLKYAKMLGNSVVRDAAVGATFGGLGGGLSELGDTKVRRSPDSDAMVQYLKTPEGAGRMASDPQFASRVVDDYADEYRESLGMKRPSNAGRIATGTAAGAGKGALVGAVAGQVRNMLSPSSAADAVSSVS